jgi:DTW domain-containing protein YfiP
MHPKEFKKVKNGTGHFTHLLLENSELFVGVDFTNHKQINNIIYTHEAFILYPSKDAIDLSNKPLHVEGGKDMVIFIIDSTWSCASKIFTESKNLQKLPHISFSTNKLSEFKIKEQPESYCLSTIESTQVVLELLNKHGLENIKDKYLDNFLNPFKEMVKYQVECSNNPKSHAVRFKRY